MLFQAIQNSGVILSGAAGGVEWISPPAGDDQLFIVLRPVPPPFSRCEKAKQLLYETNLSVSVVGAAVGYVSSAHFSHLFKKMTGIAPSDWHAPDLFSIKDPIDFTGLM